MRRQSVCPPQRLRHGLAALASAALLAACGGGGGTTSAVPPPPTTTTITGNVTDNTGAPVVDATVTLGTTSGPPAVAQTTPTGQYTLTVDPTKINTGTTLVVTVQKDGFQTCVGTVTVNATTGSVAGCTALVPVATGELYPAAADAVLVRLGDGEVTGGAINSLLQIGTPFGLSRTVVLPWQAGLDPAAYTTFTINVSMRGLQASICADKLTLLQGASAATATEVKVYSSSTTPPLLDSPSNGTLLAYALQVPAASLSASGGSVYVKIEAGACSNGTPGDPDDDFEFVGVNGKFS